jgi:hypothetical protein
MSAVPIPAQMKGSCEFSPSISRQNMPLRKFCGLFLASLGLFFSPCRNPWAKIIMSVVGVRWVVSLRISWGMVTLLALGGHPSPFCFFAIKNL